MKPTESRALRNLTVLFAVLLMTGSALAEKGIFTKRYVFFPRGWKTQKAKEENVLLLERAAAAGYNGIIFGNAGFSKMHTYSKTDAFITDFAEFRALAKRLNLTLCPNYAYQTIPTHHSLTGAEAFPVRGTPYVAGKDGEAVVEADPTLAIKNPGFEGTVGELPADWRPAGLAKGHQVFVDNEARSGSGSVCFQNLVADQSGCGIKQSMTVKPFRAYELKIWIKTEGFVNAQPSSPRYRSNPASLAQVAVYGNDWMHWVCYHNSGRMWPNQPNLKATQGWKEFRMNFNSMSNSSISLRVQPVGYHCAPTGKIWFDDITISEVGLVETVLRSTTPVIVKSASDPSISYVKGKDFTVVAETNYDNHGRLIIPEGSSIKAGDRLTVDWSILGDQEGSFASGAWCDNQAFQYLIDDNLLLHQMTGGMGAYHIAIGEWRDAGWDPVCMDLYGNAGGYMAGATLGLEAVCRLFNPKMDIYIKNDMYDPYHNAKTGGRQYFMCNGSLFGSWNGITDSAVVMNWRGSTGEVGVPTNMQVKSFLFWGGLDPEFKIKPKRQIIRFNCQSGVLHGVDKGLANIAAAEALGMTGMVGCVYNTWDGRYPAYAKMEEMAQLCKDDGRWATNPCPLDKGCDYEINLDPSTLKPPPLGVKKESFASGQQSLRLRAFANSGKGVTVVYRVPARQEVSISLVNILGQKIGKVVNRKHDSAGKHHVWLDASSVPSGIYFLQVTSRSGDRGAAQKMTRRIPLI